MLQVDDSYGLSTLDFLGQEEEASNNFKINPRSTLGIEPDNFNLLQVRKMETFEILLGKEFSRERALAKYVGVNIRPDVCAPVQLLDPVNTPTT